METATIEEVQLRLPQFIERLSNGREVIILREGKPVGRLLPPELPKGVPIPGRGKGKLTIVSEEDDHLEESKQSAMRPDQLTGASHE